MVRHIGNFITFNVSSSAYALNVSTLPKLNSVADAIVSENSHLVSSLIEHLRLYYIANLQWLSLYLWLLFNFSRRIKRLRKISVCDCFCFYHEQVLRVLQSHIRSLRLFLSARGLLRRPCPDAWDRGADARHPDRCNASAEYADQGSCTDCRDHAELCFFKDICFQKGIVDWLYE